MTPTQYIAKGFRLSARITQAVIDRAETDIQQAYITPLQGTLLDNNAAVVDAKANLVYLLICQRSIIATKAGAKIKTTDTSTIATSEENVSEMGAVCKMKLDILRATDGANSAGEVTDICKIYYKTNYFNN